MIKTFQFQPFPYSVYLHLLIRPFNLGDRGKEGEADDGFVFWVDYFYFAILDLSKTKSEIEILLIILGMYWR